MVRLNGSRAGGNVASSPDTPSLESRLCATVSRDIDAIWHAWILQTREYSTLCERLPARSFIHHSSNDYLRYFDPSVGEQNDLMPDVKMLALYVANFGPFEASRTKHWLLASHLMERRGWSVEQLNDWLLSPVAA
jgi:hypothetical protein